MKTRIVLVLLCVLCAGPVVFAQQAPPIPQAAPAATPAPPPAPANRTIPEQEGQLVAQALDTMNKMGAAIAVLQEKLDAANATLQRVKDKLEKDNPGYRLSVDPQTNRLILQPIPTDKK